MDKAKETLQDTGPATLTSVFSNVKRADGAKHPIDRVQEHVETTEVSKIRTDADVGAAIAVLTEKWFKVADTIKTYDKPAFDLYGKRVVQVTKPKKGTSNTEHFNQVMDLSKEIGEHPSIKQSEADASSTTNILEQFNSAHAMVMVGGRAFIYREDMHFGSSLAGQRKNDVVDLSERIVKIGDYSILFANKKVMYDDKLQGVVSAWSDWTDRRYQSITFNPEHKGHYGAAYNLWQGFSMEAKENVEASDLWFELLQSICGYHDEYVEFVLNWFADIIQNPARNPGIAIGISGPQGIGKNSLVTPIGKLLGEGFSDQITMDHLTGQFNGPIAAKLLTVLDEATWGGSHKEAQTIKRLITAEKDLINPKGFGHYSLPCYRRMMFLSNEAFYLRVDKDDRRILPLEPDHSKINKGNVEFWKKFKSFQDSGEMSAALLHMLSQVDLSNWNPQEAFKKLIIVTGRALVESAKEPWEHWVDEVVETGIISYPEAGHLDDMHELQIAGARIEMGDLQAAFNHWCKLNGAHVPWTNYKFRTLRTEVFGESKPSNGKRYHHMPTQEKMMEILTAKTGWQYAKKKLVKPDDPAANPLMDME